MQHFFNVTFQAAACRHTLQERYEATADSPLSSVWSRVVPAAEQMRVLLTQRTLNSWNLAVKVLREEKMCYNTIDARQCLTQDQ